MSAVIPAPTRNPDPGRLPVGTPISAGNAGQRWNNDLLVLLAALAQPIGSCSLPPVVKESDPYDVVLTYVKAPGVEVLVVSVELHVGGFHVEDDVVIYEVAKCNVLVKVDGSPATFVGGTAAANGLDGSGDQQAAAAVQRRIRPIQAFIDVSGLTVGAVTTVSVTWTQVADSAGISHVSLTEAPIPAVAPSVAPTTELGVESTWPAGDGGLGHELHDGGASRPAGFPRFIDMLDKARSKKRRHWQIFVQQADSVCWRTDATTTGPLKWGFGGFSDTQDVKHEIRPRRLYTEGTPNKVKGYVWYKTTATHNGEVTITADNGTSTATATVALSASTTWARESFSLDLPTDEEKAILTFHGKVDSGGTLYLSAFVLIEDEG